MEIIYKYSAISTSYELSDSEKNEAEIQMMAHCRPLMETLHQKFSSVRRGGNTANLILSEIKKYFFTDISGVKLVLRQPRDERMNIGNIINHCRLKIEEKEILLTDYLIQLAIIKINKAFTQIK
jgi:hypothetical protein